jgi:hypothetical protein
MPTCKTVNKIDFDGGKYVLLRRLGPATIGNDGHVLPSERAPNMNKLANVWQ